MFMRRRLRSALSVLVSAAIGVAFIGIGVNPAEADPNPIEDTYMGYFNGNVPPTAPPYSNVVYDNGGHAGTGDCDVEEEPQSAFTLVYPAPPELGDDGDHPVVVWGNGTSGTAGIAWIEVPIEDPTCLYEDMLKHLASFGFVVIAPNDGFVGSGAELQAAVGEAYEHNAVDSTHPLYQNLDLSSITAAGHSQGAGGAINAAVADSRITSVLGISTPDEGYCHPKWINAIEDGLGWEFDCVTEATVSQLDVPTFFVSGENDCDDTQLMRDWFSLKLSLRGDLYFALGPLWYEEAFYYWDLEDFVENETPCISSDISNTIYFDAISGPAAKATVLPNASGEGAGHIDVSEGAGYATAWLAYISGNPSYAGVEDAFVGASPEIASNSGWTNWQAKNLPT